MQWRQNLFLIGFLLIVFGTLLIVYSGMPSEESTFFIFPFFFFSSSPIGILLIALFAFIFVVVVKLMIQAVTRQSCLQEDIDSQESDIPVGSFCRYCSQPIPANSSFCSFCGNPINQSDDYSERV
jgi:hypothetical protein